MVITDGPVVRWVKQKVQTEHFALTVHSQNHANSKKEEKSMKEYNNGTIEFDLPISEELKQEILNILCSSEDWHLQFSGKKIAFADFEDCDLEGSFNEITEQAKEAGNPITSGNVEYDGDYDGAYVFDKEKEVWNCYDRDDLGVLRASDDKLLDELIRRGVIKVKNRYPLPEGKIATVYIRESNNNK